MGRSARNVERNSDDHQHVDWSVVSPKGDTAMLTPTTYAEWMLVLDRFSAGDDSVIAVMNEGTLEWTNVVAERWTRQVAACLNGRLQAVSTQLQTNLDRSRGDYFSISNALLMARRALTPLRSFVSLPVFPDDVEQHLVAELDRWVSNTQNSLERHAATVRDDHGRLLKTIRDHPLNAVSSDVPACPRTEAPADVTNPPVRGRRVIL